MDQEMKWRPCHVLIQTTSGEQWVSGFVHPDIPGIAVTLQIFVWTITHIRTGYGISAEFERAPMAFQSVEDHMTGMDFRGTIEDTKANELHIKAMSAVCGDARDECIGYYGLPSLPKPAMN